MAASVVSIAADVGAGRRSAVDVARESLAALEAQDGRVKSFLEVSGELALEEARRTDARVAAGERLPLAGVPMAIKDNMWVEGRATTCASRILEGFRPGRDATAVARLRQAGAVFVGKTNLDEFAMGSSTEHSAFQVTRNPWDLSRIPGGSSGGSAAAVASRFVPAALGSDTGGSIRQPAACCGVVGFKPTYGRVSRYGLVAFGSSLDQIGPLTRSVADAARVYAVMAGEDPCDSTTLQDAVGVPEAAVARGASGLRVGFLTEAQVEGLDPRIAKNLQDARRAFQLAGAEVFDVSIPRAPYAIAIYYLVASAEASSNLARFDGVREGLRASDADLAAMYFETRRRGFGEEVKRRILLGTFALASGYYEAYYGRAMRARALLSQDFADAFARCDVLVCPSTPSPAFAIGEKLDDPLAMYLSDIFTVPASLAGLPAISIPSGLTEDGLPLSMQVIGPRLGEEAVFTAAAALERELSFPDETPRGLRQGP
ncbi:MAG TPA: Asp-tRNA(Asn)/Glu-tRNA(Gln) amidotransferase subunit GatA [Thermoanaerobaculia bacterium]|jgi:aspartyl-tRNA(Asn)/glutamyl-tRNA(Gln) amidotransferase subunit A